MIPSSCKILVFLVYVFCFLSSFELKADIVLQFKDVPTVSKSNNSFIQKQAQFIVFGVSPGNTIYLYKNKSCTGDIIFQKKAENNSTFFHIPKKEFEQDNYTYYLSAKDLGNGSCSKHITFKIKNRESIEDPKPSSTPALPKISYSSPQSFTQGVAKSISPTSTGGAVSSYSVSPTLPAGLSLNSTTGVISGTPTSTSATTTYTITATNSSGSSTAPLSITVVAPPSSCTEPTIDSVTSDNLGSGSQVTINGCGFQSNHSVWLWRGDDYEELSQAERYAILVSSKNMIIAVPWMQCTVTKEILKVSSSKPTSPPAFVTSSSSSSPNLALSSIAPVNPGRLDTTCMTNSNYDSCIFFKNPVAQQGKIFTPALTNTTDLSSIQIYGVNLGISGQTLDNNNISVCGDSDGTYKRFIKNNSWKISYVDSRTNRELEQVMAFYWINNQINMMKQWTGSFYAAEKKIQVFAYNPVAEELIDGKWKDAPLDNAHWISDLNTIRMGASTANPAVTYGMAAEVYAHELGHGNLDYATSNASIDASSCSDTKGCLCYDNKGCIGAIHEGQADYHAALMFGPGPTGESIKNNMNGLDSTCTVSRTLSKNSNLSADTAYIPNANCKYTSDNTVRQGAIHDMGALYASMWWEVRKKAGVTSGKTNREVDQLFMEHLATLQSDDNFVTTLCKIADIDKNIFSSRYSQLFSDEYIRRGLPGLESCK